MGLRASEGVFEDSGVGACVCVLASRHGTSFLLSHGDLTFSLFLKFAQSAWLLTLAVW